MQHAPNMCTDLLANTSVIK